LGIVKYARTRVLQVPASIIGRTALQTNMYVQQEVMWTKKVRMMDAVKAAYTAEIANVNML
jgi:hypothetical protein